MKRIITLISFITAAYFSVAQSVGVMLIPSPYRVSGGGTICSGGVGATIALDGSQVNVSYQLRVNGVNTGPAIMGTGSPMSWTNQAAAGTYTVIASSGSNSQEMEGNAVVVVLATPVLYVLSGGGVICNGSPGTAISLSGSEVGVNYQLRVNGNNFRSPIAGTGAALTWSDVATSGSYSVYATRTCNNQSALMNGDATVTIVLPPHVLTVTGGGQICPEQGAPITVSQSQSGISYQLQLNGVSSGSLLVGNGANITWNAKSPGTYTVLASNSYCSQQMNGSPVVSIIAGPIQYTLSGGGAVCSDEPTPMVLNGSEIGVSYQAMQNGINFGAAKSGTGSPLTWPNLQVYGNATYTVIATGGSPTSCVQSMGSINVTVTRRPTAFSISGGGCSGNSINLGSSEVGVNYQLRVDGVDIGALKAGTGNPLSWTNNTTGGVYSIVASRPAGCPKTMTGTVTLYPPITSFDVSGGGTFCTDFSGATITLAGSETGVNYQLKRSGTNVGTPVAGTGAALNWPGQPSAAYLVVATQVASSCTKNMDVAESVNVHPPPLIYTLTLVGNSTICPGSTGTMLRLSKSQAGITYQLQLNGVNLGIPKAGNGGELLWTNQNGAGSYSVVATIMGCSKLMDGSPVINVIEPPPVSITGLNKVGAVPIVLQANIGADYTYQWKRDGDAINNETSSSLSISTPGEYDVVVTNSQGCSATSATHFVSTEFKPYFNGLISSVRWRTDKPYQVAGIEHKGMYAYTYDAKYQIKEAIWAEPDFAQNTFQFANNKFRLGDMSYDPNGNILTLKRYNEAASRIHNFAYTYTANKNKLQSVSGHVNAYTYNAIGQMTGEDKTTGDDQYVEYDVTGKVVKVFSDAVHQTVKVEYVYDDRGFRLAKCNYATNLTTWYVRDATGNVISTYEQEGVISYDTNGNPVLKSETLHQKEITLYGAGKLGTVLPEEDNSTAYEITDHLGNVRALVREDVNTYTATMEDSEVAEYTNPRVKEMNFFHNLFETEVDDVNMNHTSPEATVVTNPSKSAYLFWQSGMTGMGASDKAVGPAAALRVNPGDKVQLETWTRFENKTEYDRGFDLAMLSQILGATFAATAGFDGMTSTQTANTFNGGLGAEGFGSDGSDDERPFAYLNYAIFNDNMQMVDAGWQRIPAIAGFENGEEGLPNGHQRLAFEQPIEIDESGYIYVWVSNESENTKVWFDDLSVTHTRGIVTQATDYGVWGDVLREQKSDESTYRYGYQGQFAEKDEETGWNHFELREYDPVIGRWTATDPYGQYWSPYLGMGNDPVNGVDPDGGFCCGGEDMDMAYADAMQQMDINFSDEIRMSGSLLSAIEISPQIDQSIVNHWLNFDETVLDNLPLLGMKVLDEQNWAMQQFDQRMFYDPLDGQGYSVNKDGFASGPLLTTGTADFGAGPRVVKIAKDAKKIIVIGENMAERVIPYARKIGAKWFKPRGTNPANWMKNQVKWIMRQIKDPNTTIIDYGPDLTRPVRSKYYMKELEMINKHVKQ